MIGFLIFGQWLRGSICSQNKYIFYLRRVVIVMCVCVCVCDKGEALYVLCWMGLACVLGVLSH